MLRMGFLSLITALRTQKYIISKLPIPDDLDSSDSPSYTLQANRD